MSTLENIVNVTITSSSRGITRLGFGIPLVISKFAPSIFSERAKQYDLGTAAVDMVVDGFTLNDPAVLAVLGLARNTPKPTKVIVGRLLTAFNQAFVITVKTIVAVGGEVFAFSIRGPGGVVTQITYTAIAADTETVIATALDTQIDAITDLTSAQVAGVMTVTADTADEMFYTNGLDLALFDYSDTTVDSNLATELTEIQVINNDWYGLILADPPSSARITALATYIETQEKIFGATTHDTATGDPGSSADIAFTLNASTLLRTYPIYSGNQSVHAAATWMGNNFPFTPGSQTWAFKPLAGVLADNLTSAFQAGLDGKKCNYYTSILGAAATNGGNATGGTMAGGEFIDVIRGRDKLTQGLRERIFGLLINIRKVPYTDAGIAMVTKEVEAELLLGISNGYLSPDNPVGQDTPFIVTAPKASEVSAADKTARLLPNVFFSATLAGAIHAIQINGTISV